MRISTALNIEVALQHIAWSSVIKYSLSKINHGFTTIKQNKNMATRINYGLLQINKQKQKHGNQKLTMVLQTLPIV